MLYIFQYDILSHLLKEEKDQGTVYMKREHYERRGTPKKLKWVSVGIARGKKEIKKKKLGKVLCTTQYDICKVHAEAIRCDASL